MQGTCQPSAADVRYSPIADINSRLPYAFSAKQEPVVSAENWHEERDRLVQLLEGIESGKITHIDEKDLRQLQATNPENVALLKERLAKLNARLGDDDG
jgi:hypothetical protein